MFEHLTTPEEIFSYKLGSALTMEHDSLEIIEDMEKTVMRSELREFFREHAHETRQQIENLEQCFASLGQEANRTPSPTMKGFAKEAKSFIAKTDETLVDAVVLAVALETEHHETAVRANAEARTQADPAPEPEVAAPLYLPPGTIYFRIAPARRGGGTPCPRRSTQV